MTSLLNHVIDAHGGLKPWEGAAIVEADITYGGPFWELKGVPDFVGTDHVTADIRRQHAILRQPGGRVIEFDKDVDILTVTHPDSASPTAHYDVRHASFNGVLVTTARRIHLRNDDRTPDRSGTPITIDFADVRMS